MVAFDRKRVRNSHGYPKRLDNMIPTYEQWHKETFGCEASPDGRLGRSQLDVGLRDGYNAARDAATEAVKPKLIALAELVIDLDFRAHSGYDWNADPDNMTSRVGDVILEYGDVDGKPVAEAIRAALTAEEG